MSLECLFLGFTMALCSEYDWGGGGGEVKESLSRMESLI